MVIVADLVRKLMLSSQTKLLRGTQVQFNTYGQTIFQFSYGFVQGKSRFGKQAAGVKDGIQLRCPVCISQITLHLWRIAPLTSLHTINERRRRQDQRAFHWIKCLTELWSQLKLQRLRQLPISRLFTRQQFCNVLSRPGFSTAHQMTNFVKCDPRCQFSRFVDDRKTLFHGIENHCFVRGVDVIVYASIVHQCQTAADNLRRRTTVGFCDIIDMR